MYEPLMSIQTMLPKHYVKLLCKIPVCLKINIFHFSFSLFNCSVNFAKTKHPSIEVETVFLFYSYSHHKLRHSARKVHKMVKKLLEGRNLNGTHVIMRPCVKNSLECARTVFVYNTTHILCHVYTFMCNIVKNNFFKYVMSIVCRKLHHTTCFSFKTN